MILNDTPTNEAILSNVGSVNSFSIKATAKSFSILSSGLYANKVRAIIRELACNALDSHVAARQTNIPFVIHLPNAMEPYFSVRDFGTGLSHDQVVGIFTTFFESTKTGSNDFIGALGLGSKSPFSYTDNFTVIAVKDGQKGIYTAFINEVGVPSIALMMSEDTDEPNGVEIKFAVNERYDFTKFRDEARQVFKFWVNRPTITGSAGFTFIDPEFKDRDIVPGVHSMSDSYANGTGSIAVMGNIAYRIEVPAADTTIPDDLKRLLNCNLVIEFNIGDLDFQASREGLSYVPLTINSIKAKLELLNSQLTVRLADAAHKIDNLWARAAYLHNRIDDALWAAAVNKYVADTNFPLLNPGANRWNALKTFNLGVTELATKFNIVIRGFSKNRGMNACSNLKSDTVTDRSSGTTVFKSQWQIRAEMDRFFVFNDTKIGALERAKYHWRRRSQNTYSEVVYVIEAADNTLPMKRDEFLAEIMNPPAANVMNASALEVKERAAGLGKNVSILRLENQSRGYRYADTVVWKDAGKADAYDAGTTYYYLPLSGYKSLGKVEDIKWLKDTLEKSEIFTGYIFGVRKSDAEWVQTQSNWVNLDTYVGAKLAAMSDADVMGIVKEAIRFKDMFHWTVSGLDAASLYGQLAAEFKGVKTVDSVRRSALQALCREYKVVTATLDPESLIATYQAKMNAVKERYPLLSHISRYTDDSLVSDYIRLIDRTQVIQNS